MFTDTYDFYYGQKRDEVRLSYWGSNREHSMWGDVITAFEARNPRITVKREQVA